jgi:hypothetical protein
VYFVIVYREEVHKNHEYIQNVKMAMLKNVAPRLWAWMPSQTNLQFIVEILYREGSCKIFEYIQNVNFKRLGPMIVGLDAFTNHFLVFGWNVILASVL